MLSKILNIASYVIVWLLRPSFKWVLHVLTGRSEIERIIYGKLRGASRTKAIEYSLEHSYQSSLRDLTVCPLEAVDSAVQYVMKLKNVANADISSLRLPLRGVLVQILGYNQLIRQVEWQRKILYNRENADHEKLLLHLWSLLKPATPLEHRKTKQWQDIGFQGDDPATDFRGMGLLGLEQLVYLCEAFPEQAQRIYARSLHPKLSYPFAIAGISFTSLTLDLLRNGYLKVHFYNTLNGSATLRDFHEIYCRVFCLFDDLWFKLRPENVLAFNSVRDQLYGQLTAMLTSDDSATWQDVAMHNIPQGVDIFSEADIVQDEL